MFIMFIWNCLSNFLRKREAFVKVKLVIVNIKFKLDISMLVMVTILGIKFGA